MAHSKAKLNSNGDKGLKRHGRGIDNRPTTNVEVNDKVELYFYSPSGPTWLVLG